MLQIWHTEQDLYNAAFNLQYLNFNSLRPIMWELFTSVVKGAIHTAWFGPTY